jgi:hypothetical protein
MMMGEIELERAREEESQCDGKVERFGSNRAVTTTSRIFYPYDTMQYLRSCLLSKALFRSL